MDSPVSGLRSARIIETYLIYKVFFSFLLMDLKPICLAAVFISLSAEDTFFPVLVGLANFSKIYYGDFCPKKQF